MSINETLTSNDSVSFMDSPVIVNANGTGNWTSWLHEDATFDQVMLVLKVIQLLVGFCGNSFSLTVLLLYRHYLSHPFWFYLVAICTIDFLGCFNFIIFMEEPLNLYHTALFNNNLINEHLETWILDMLRDLNAWLIVFIAIERWKSVCWPTSPSSTVRYHHNHHCHSHDFGSSRQLAAPVSSHGNSIGLASFKRRTAQLETFFIVTGALMIINATHYFAAKNSFMPTEEYDLSQLPESQREQARRILNASDLQTRTTQNYLANQWNVVWPFLKEIKQCWVPALVILVLNVWIVVYTVRFLWWHSPRLPIYRLRALRRLTSSSISTHTHNATTTTALTGGSMSPIAVNVHAVTQNQNQNASDDGPKTTAAASASVIYHRNQAQRRRRLVFAWLTLLALPTIFITMTLPMSIYYVMDELGPKIGDDPDEHLAYQRRDKIVSWLADCNYTVNCFIYCLTIAKFRLAVRRMGQSLFGCCQSTMRILRKRSRVEEFPEGNDERAEQCQLSTLMEKARCLNKAQKRKFIVGVVENVEAISSFNNHRAIAENNALRRVNGMDSGIAFDHANFIES